MERQVQEAFPAAIAGIAGYRGEVPLFAWLLRDRHHLEERVQALLRRGIAPRNDGWGGWSGRYQTALAQAAKGKAPKAKALTLHDGLDR
jgi:hypothetical protein